LFHNLQQMSILPALIGTIGYIELSSSKLQERLQHVIPAAMIQTFSVVHNALLASFSLVVFSYLSYTIFHGIVFQHRHFFQNSDIQIVIEWVYLSKVYEYMDTVLLYMKKKQPIFLQKYHHLGAVVVWYLSYLYQCDFIVYVSWLNCGVHAIMYSYYLTSTFKKNIPSVVKRVITASQILQLAVGLTVLPTVYFRTETCACWNVLLLFVAYTTYLLVLFVEFSWNTYSRKGGDKTKLE